MIDLNIGNAITIAIISVAALAATKFILAKTGVAGDWL